MAICKVNTCDRDVWGKNEDCILHTNKNSEEWEGYNEILAREFYESLVDYLVNKIECEHDAILNKFDLRTILSPTGMAMITQEITEFLRGICVECDQIWFPGFIQGKSFDYSNILKLFGWNHFIRCTFSSGTIELLNSRLCFEKCVFIKNWYIKDHIKWPESLAVYEKCSFLGKVALTFDAIARKTIWHSQFANCEFTGDIFLEGMTFKEPIFVYDPNITERKQKFNKISIDNCTFDKPFEISGSKLDELRISICNFRSLFLAESTTIKSTFVDNCRFGQLVSFKDSTLEEFTISNTTFDEYTTFEGCSFGVQAKVGNKPAEIAFVTFQSFCSFSEAKFLCGLNLRRVSMKESPNFLGVGIDSKSTDRETFRIIKDSFDKVGNFIEGNRFYKFEMLKRWEELSKQKRSWEKIVYLLYKISSDFGQSIGRPLILILLMAALYTLLSRGKQNNWLYSLISDELGEYIDSGFGCLNEIAKSVLPFQNILMKGMEMLSLIFYVIFTSLIWLVILAIKRHTKR